MSEGTKGDREITELQAGMRALDEQVPNQSDIMRNKERKIAELHT